MSPNTKSNQEILNIQSTSRELEIKLIHLELGVRECGDPIPKDTLRKTLNSKLRRVFEAEKTVLRDINLSHGSNDKSLSYYEDEGVTRYEGSVILDHALTSPNVALKVTNFCQNESFSGNWLQLADSCFDCLFPPELRSSHPNQNIKSFGMGSLIDMRVFISHFTSEYDKSASTKGVLNKEMRIAQDDIKGEFLHDQNKLFIIFRTTTGTLKGYKTPQIIHFYKLVYDYSSINKILLDVNHDTIVAYLVLNDPPLLYQLERDLKKECLQKHEHHWNCLTEEESKEKYTHIHDIKSNDYFLRVTEFEGATKEIISKSNVLRLEIDRVKNNGYYKTRPDLSIPCPWSVFSCKFLSQQIQSKN